MDSAQQQALLSLDKTVVANRLISCSLPKSASMFHKEVIFGVPISESAADMLEALKDQDVVEVQRSLNREDNDKPHPTVFLFFASGLPPSVKLSSITYEVRHHIPNPYRCTKCWHLGHTKTHCSSIAKCKRCGGSHDEAFICATKCVNCNRPDHESDSVLCPAYLELKQVIRISVLENMSIRDARLKLNTLNSRMIQRQSMNPSNPPTFKVPSR